VEFANEKRKKPPLRIAPAACGLWLCAVPRRQRWERRPRGVKESLLDVSMKPNRYRQTTLRSSLRLTGPPVRRITVPRIRGRNVIKSEKSVKWKCDAEAQNLVAACSNCLSLVVGFRGNTICKNRFAPEKSPHALSCTVAHRNGGRKTSARLKSRHEEKSRANRQHIFEDCDHEIGNVQRFHQPRASLIASERARDPARGAQDSANRQGLRARQRDSGSA